MIHPMMTSGLTVGTIAVYYYHSFEWHYNMLNKKPLSRKEYLKKNFMNIASYGIHGFIIGSVLGSFALLASGPTRNIIAVFLPIGFCVVARIIDVSL